MDPYELDDGPDTDKDLAALSEAAGSAYAPPPPMPQGPYVPVDIDGRLIHDTACILCGYNLRGQLPHGTCPECGGPVGQSIRTDRLDQADPGWLGNLKQSMTWMITATFTLIGLQAVAVIANVVIASQQSVSGTQNPFAPVPTTAQSAIALIITIIQAALFGIAYWLLTTPETGRPPTQSGDTPRVITRWMILSGYTVLVLATLIQFGQSPPAMIIGGIVQVVSGLMLMAGFFASLAYLRSLARRVPDRGLAGQTTIVMWGSLIAGCVFILAMIGMMVALFASISASQGASGPSPAMGVGMAAAGLVMCGVGLAVLVFAVWWIVLLFFYRGHFARAHHAALGNGPHLGL